MGLALAGFFALLLLISTHFGPDRSDIEKPIVLLVLIMMAVGSLYLWFTNRIKDNSLDKRTLVEVILIGLLFRGLMFVSVPMLEDDYYRYLWDGGVTAHGMNPYEYAPQDLRYAGQNRSVPDTLLRLAKEGDQILARINYPWLKTIYPPAIQVVFAIAHLMRPWSLVAWRLVLFTADLLTVFLLLKIIRILGLPSARVVFYWWNPLLIKEIYNSGHMDVVILPFLLWAFLLFVRRKYLSTSAAVGLAVGTKLWPALLVPVFLRPIAKDVRRLLPCVIVLGVLSAAMLFPIYQGGLDHSSGFRAYKTSWEMNDALFMLLLWGAKFLVKTFDFDFWNSQMLARVSISIILLGWTLGIIRKNDSEPTETARRCLMVIAALFLLSPTQFPWYYLWMLPFLGCYPQSGLLLLTVLLPLYYLRFYLDARGLVKIHDYGIVWLEFVPVWWLIVRDWLRGRIGHHPHLQP